MKNLVMILTLLGLVACCDNTMECMENEISITVFEHANYEGESQEFPLGVHFINALDNPFNDIISSFRVSDKNCIKVTLCEHPNPADLGLCKEFFSDQVFVDELNDKVSFIKVEMQ